MSDLQHHSFCSTGLVACHILVIVGVSKQQVLAAVIEKKGENAENL